MDFYQISNILENIKGLIQIKENEKLQFAVINDCEKQVVQIEHELSDLRNQYNFYNDLLREIMMSSVQSSCCVSGLCYQK